MTMGPDARSRQVMLLTGGSRGIGAAIARHAVTAGYGVCFTYSSDHGRAEQTAEALRAVGGEVAAVHADAADAHAAARVFDEAEAALGPVTAVVNNAGVTGQLAPLHEATLADMRRVLDVNVWGTLVMARQAVRRWLHSRAPGGLVNITSIASTTGAPNEYVAYAASKAAIEALTVGLAKEVASRSIRVNAVAPGTTQTEIHAAAGEPGRPARVAQRTPLGRVAEVDEIAAAVLWLLSDEASYVTGAVLKVAGGV